MRRRPVVVAAMPAAIALLAGCGGAHHATTGLSVTPAHPATTSRISFRFIAPVAAGVHGDQQTGYSLSVTGTPGAACVSAREADAAPVGRGMSARVSIGPAARGGRWCAGLYTARAFELQRPVCQPGVPCPQVIRVVAIVARGRFTVAPG